MHCEANLHLSGVMHLARPGLDAAVRINVGMMSGA